MDWNILMGTLKCLWCSEICKCWYMCMVKWRSWTCSTVWLVNKWGLCPRVFSFHYTCHHEMAHGIEYSDHGCVVVTHRWQSSGNHCICCELWCGFSWLPRSISRFLIWDSSKNCMSCELLHLLQPHLWHLALAAVCTVCEQFAYVSAIGVSTSCLMQTLS